MSPKKRRLFRTALVMGCMLLMFQACYHEEEGVKPNDIGELTERLKYLATSDDRLKDEIIVWNKLTQTQIGKHITIVSYPILTQQSDRLKRVVGSVNGENNSTTISLWTLHSDGDVFSASHEDMTTHEVLRNFSGKVNILDLINNTSNDSYYKNGSIRGVSGARTNDDDWPAVCANCHNATWLPEVIVPGKPDLPFDPFDPCNYTFDPCTCAGIGCAGVGGGGSGANPGQNPDDELTNNVTNPCLHQQVENAISSNLSNELSGLMQSIFNINEDINIEFNQSNNLAAGVAAVTNATGSGGYLKVKITLNANTLPTRSQEYIMSTIYHEILHAVMVYNNIEQDQEHQNMATDYIERLSRALREHFPGLTPAQANDLSWGGLQKTNAWNALSNNEKNRITNLNIQHQNGSAGTPCN